MNTQPPTKIANWKSVPDWINLAFGALLIILAVAIEQVHTTYGVVLGLVLIAAVVWDMVMPSTLSAAAQGIAGFLIFLLPWFGSFAGSGASWLAWTIGILTIIVAIWSWASHPSKAS